MIRAAVVILNWNGEKFLQQFLPGVVENSSLPNVDVYVADNASTDNSVEILKMKFPSVKLVLLDKNHGFAGGYNEALKQIQAEYYILLNSDVEVTPNWIEPILNVLEQNPTVAAVMPKLRSWYNRDLFEYAGAAGGFIDYLGYPFCRGRIVNLVEKDTGQYDDDREIFWATGACMFIRSDLFHSIGGFDASFFAHMEEIDLCWRLKNQGYSIMYSSASTVYHVGGGALPKENPRKTYLNFRNSLFLLYKNLHPSRLIITIILRMIIDAGVSLRFVTELKFNHSFAVLKAYTHFFFNIPRLNKLRKRHVMSNYSEVYRGSIVLDFFLRKRKTFKALKFN